MFSKEYIKGDKMLSVENFGQWILSELEKRNWSQSDLVRASGISRGTLSNIISGTRGVGQDSVIAIAHALKISPLTLFRQAGLLPSNNGGDVKLDDWEFLLKQMTPEDEAELRQIAEMKIERRKKDQSVKTLKPKKAG